MKGVNTPELHGTPKKKKAAALKAKKRVEELILNEPVLIRSYKDTTSFERFIGELYFFPTPFESIPDTTEFVIVADKKWYSLSSLLLKEMLGDKIETESDRRFPLQSCLSLLSEGVV